tara:strand:+ start:2845 stop:4467 length:1623 start_codon:yes stop_codon:yes gene_type:complete
MFTIILCNGCGKVQKDIKNRGLTIYQEARSSWVRNFNPLIPDGSARWPTSSGIYEPLFIYNSITGKHVPWLALDFNWETGNRILIMTTRNNVKWSDGEPFSAKDVSFTFNYKRLHRGLDTRDSWGYLNNVNAISDTTVRFEFKRIYVPGFDDIASQPIVPEHIWKDVNDPLKFPNPIPVATGPYTEIIRFENQLWELGKNPNYWQPGKPQIKKLRFPTFPSNEQVTLALISGNLDWAGAFIPAIDRVYVKKDTVHHKYWFPQTGHTTFFYVNTQNPVLSDANIRKAISYSIDRKLVVKVGMYNYTVPAHVTGISGRLSNWHHPDIEKKENWVQYNPDKANQILDQAGYYINKNGIREKADGSIISFDIIIVSGWSDWIRSAQIVSQNLKDIGIIAKVRTYDFGAWISKMQKGEFEMAVGWTEKGSTPYPLYRGMMSSKYVRPIGETSVANWHRFGLPEADSLFLKFEQTSNMNEKKIIMYKLQDLFIDNAPALPLFAEVSWAECNTKYFTNFPSKENPYATLSPNYHPEHLLVMVNLKNR